MVVVFSGCVGHLKVSLGIQKLFFLSIRDVAFATLASVCVMGMPLRAAHASQYDVPPYADTIFNCQTGVGCCSPSGVTSILIEMFRGGGLYVQDLQQYFYVNTLFPKIDKALKQVSDDVRNAVAFSIASKGAMLDAQTFLNTNLSLQKLNTTTMQDFTVSDQVCRLGTLSRSLANSQDKARVVHLGLADRMSHRQTLQTGMVSGYTNQQQDILIGRSADKKARFKEYQSTFCNPEDLSGGTRDVCQSPNDAQYNRDINVTRTWDVPLTLDIDFTPDAQGQKPTMDEKNIMALSSNLYANDLSVNISKSDFQMLNNVDAPKVDGQIEKILGFRSVEAKRSVANNSFAALTAMKAAGSGAATDYMRNMLTELGLDQGQPDVDNIELRRLAAMGRQPSYYAQMEFLTRKLYQSPQFYANLMDSPANVERQKAALESISLMQDRDIFESLRRSEALLSTLLEVQISREQDGYNDKGVK